MQKTSPIVLAENSPFVHQQLTPMQEALYIAMIGMGYVFFFLCLLILLLLTISYALKRFSPADAPLVNLAQSPAVDYAHLTIATAAVEYHLKHNRSSFKTNAKETLLNSQ